MKDKVNKVAQAIYTAAVDEDYPYVGGNDDLSNVVLDGGFDFIRFAEAAIAAIEVIEEAK